MWFLQLLNYRPVFSFLCKITKNLYNLILPECIGNKQLIISFLLQAIVSAPPPQPPHTPIRLSHALVATTFMKLQGSHLWELWLYLDELIMMGVGTLFFTNHMHGEAKGTIHKTLDAITVVERWPLWWSGHWWMFNCTWHHWVFKC